MLSCKYISFLVDWLIAVSNSIIEEMFYFVEKRIPHLCRFWRFANAYSHVRSERRNQMRALRVFGSFVYMTAVIFFCLCISAGPLCTFTINNVIVGRAVSSRVLDEVYRGWPEVTYGQMEAIEKGITDSAALQRLTGDLLDAMAEEAVMEETAKIAEMAESAGRTGNEAAIFLTDKTVEELKEGIYSEVIKEMGELLTEEQKTVLEDGIEIQVNIIADGS